MTSFNGPVSSSSTLGGESTTDTSGFLIATKGYTFRISTLHTPGTSADNGNIGEIRIDANYIYVCTAANTWKRAALSTF